MSARVVIVRMPDGTVHVEVDAPTPNECAETARRLEAIALLLGGKLKGMEVPLDPQVALPAPKKVEA